MSSLESSKVIVIEVFFGGLGDHLFYSPLPRLLKEFGFADKVYLSKLSKCRNVDTIKHVWDSNPYLDGHVDGPGSQRILGADSKAKVQKVINIILHRFGINLDYEVLPEIYGVKKSNSQPRHQYLIDLNYISYCGALTFFDKLGIILRHQRYTLVNPSLLIRIIFPFRSFLYTKSLEEYICLIGAAKSLVCLTSGGATLAAALKTPTVVYYGFGHSELNRHSILEYRQVGGNGFIRRLLSRMYWKLNMMRISKSKNN